MRLQRDHRFAPARPGEAAAVLLRQVIDAGDVQQRAVERFRHAGDGHALPVASFQAQGHARAGRAAGEEHAGRTFVSGEAGDFRQPGQVAVVGIAQAVAEGEQRVVALLPHVVDVLRGRARPTEAQFSLEVVLHAALRGAQQHVGDTRAFRTGQPCGHEGIGRIEFAVDPQRAPAEEHRDHGNAVGLEPLDQRQVGVVARLVGQGRPIALELRVRVLAEHHHRDVRLGRVLAVDRQHGLAARGLGLLRETFVDGVRIREVLAGGAGALPVQRPAAGLLADVVGAVAGHQDALLRRQRQQTALVLQQHQRLAHRLPCHRPMRRCADQRELPTDRARRRLARLEQAQPHLDPQDPAHRIVQALPGNGAVLRRRQRGGVEALPTVRGHGHVQAGVDGGGAIGRRAALDLSVAVPVADHEATEVHAPLQRVGQVGLVTMHLFAVDAVERGHRGLRTGGDGRGIARGVDADQLGLTDPGVALVTAVGGAAIAQEVLDRGDHVAAIEERWRAHLALQPFDHRAGVAGHHRGRFGIALVGASPAIVLRHRHGRREGPLHAGGARFQRGDFADPAQQRRIAGRAQTDVVREQRGADDVALPVHGIDAEQHRNRLAAVRGVHRHRIERIGQRQPFGRRGVVAAARIGIAAGQDRPQAIGAYVLRRQAADIALHQLADLFLHRHGGDQVGEALFQRGILGQRPVHAGPGAGLHAGGRRGLDVALAHGEREQQRGQQRAAVAGGIGVGHGAAPCRRAQRSRYWLIRFS